MGRIFSADEVFQIALELEETGQVFYEALAVSSQDEQVSALCRRLAEMEADHYRKFQQMRQRLISQPGQRELSAEEAAYTQALINDRVIPDPHQARRLAAGGSLWQMLDLAIRLENDSIGFYSRVLTTVDAADARAIARIIEEERAHARDLTQARRHLR
jgi:rubrerythrin